MAKQGTIDIKLPRTKNDFRIRHLPLVTDPRLARKFPSIELKVDTLWTYTGISKPRLYTVHLPHIDHMFSVIMARAAEMDINSNPPDVIELKGQRFKRIDPEKAPGGWHADYNMSDFAADPVRLACMCYIPESTFYGEIDEHDNIKYPIASRHHLFADEFPLEVYIQLTGFFLPRFNLLTRDFMARQKRARRIAWVRERISGLGRSFSTLLRRNTT